MGVGPALGPGGEFDRIRNILQDLPPQPGSRVGPGDDAAVLADGTVLSTDLSVEGVHFRLDWISPEEAGGRAVVAALSDLAAMAAEPTGVLLSLAVPETGPGPELFMAGVRERIDEMGIPLLGGDLTRSPGPVILDAVVVGRVGSPLRRAGSRVGDALWVTGTLGGAAAAVAAWNSGGVPHPEFRERFVQPQARIPEARWLRERCVLSAGLDLSDGVAGDAAHLAAASGVGVLLRGDALPVHPRFREGAADGKGDGDPALDFALHGGEDYELLLAAPPGELEPWVEEFRRSFDLSLTRVGEVVEGDGVWILHGEVGRPTRVERGGWDHFRGMSSESGREG